MSSEQPFAPKGGDAQYLSAQALGEPGQRRFRIVTVIDGDTFILWMEKQQVEALGLAIQNLVNFLPATATIETGSDTSAMVDEATRYQFRVGRIEIAFDQAEGRIVMAAYDIELPETTSEPTLRVRFDTRMATDMADEAADLMTRGRPRCPMCGGPIDPEGHFCPEQNGHLPYDWDTDVFSLLDE